MNTAGNLSAALPGGIDGSTVFASIFANYPDALLLVDAAGLIVLANPEAARLLGYSLDELDGLPVEALVPDAIRPRHESYRHAYSRNPHSRPMGTHSELVARRRDGTVVMVEIALSPLQSQGVPLVVAAIRDIGEYPRVKQALQRARYSEHLAQLGRLAVDTRDPQVVLDEVPVIAVAALEVETAAVFLLESSGVSLRLASGVGFVTGEDVGAQVANHPGTAPGHVLAQGTPVVVTDYAAERRFEVPPAYLQAGLARAIWVPLSDRGRVIGALAVHSRGAMRQDSDEIRFLESLSNLLATSQQRAQTEEALNHAQRLESVGQLTGGIAHDFNNLLTVIRGNLQVLEELPALATDAHARQLVGAATRASQRGAELTGKLLAFSRRQVLLPSPVDVGALLHSLADMLRRTLDQRIVIEVDAAACPPCLADPGQLESALLNIAINARDAMPEGGTLRFQARLATALPPDVSGDGERGAASAAGFVAIAITDSGIGMTDDVKERAFEPFFTTKEAGRGTGLGLSTVYGFVKQSRGAIAIASVLGAGTRVTLYIPAARQTAEAQEPPDAGQEIPVGLRVLLVEDDAEVRSVVRTFLTFLKCRVTTSGSGEQGLLCLEDGAGFDVLLTDIALGAGMRGTQLAARAQQLVPGLGVLLMSGFSTELLEADRESPPTWELLPKPFSRDDLAQALTRVINER